jgi:hypothetical protein
MPFTCASRPMLFQGFAQQIDLMTCPFILLPALRLSVALAVT